MTTELERLVSAFQAATTDMGGQISAAMTAWREASGLPASEDHGYLGNRCGWYPEKPKRSRTARRLDRA